LVGEGAKFWRRATEGEVQEKKRESNQTKKPDFDKTWDNLMVKELQDEAHKHVKNKIETNFREKSGGGRRA